MSTYAENNEKILYATALDNTNRVPDYPPTNNQVMVDSDPNIHLRSWLAVRKYNDQHLAKN